MQEKVLVTTVNVDLGYSAYSASTRQYSGVCKPRIDCTILDQREYGEYRAGYRAKCHTAMVSMEVALNQMISYIILVRVWYREATVKTQKVLFFLELRNVRSILSFGVPNDAI